MILNILTSINDKMHSSTDTIITLIASFGGIVLGFALNETKNRTGRLRIVCMDNEIYYYGDYNKENDSMIAENLDTAKSVIVKLKIDFISSFQIPRILRDIEIVFVNKNNVPNDFSLKDNSTRIGVNSLEKSCVIRNITINPFGFISMSTDVVISKDDFIKIDGIKSIKVKYTNEKNRIETKEILKSKDIRIKKVK